MQLMADIAARLLWYKHWRNDVTLVGLKENRAGVIQESTFSPDVYIYVHYMLSDYLCLWERIRSHSFDLHNDKILQTFSFPIQCFEQFATRARVPIDI